MIQKQGSVGDTRSVAAKKSAYRRLKKVIKVMTLGLVLLLLGVCALSWGRRTMFLQMRAERGDAQAQYWLGRAMFNSAANAAEYQQALGWLNKAAEGNQVIAQLGLGLIYARGVGVPRDQEKALAWLQRAATGSEDVQSLSQEIKRSYLARCLQLFPDSSNAWAREVAHKNLELAAAVRGTSLPQVSTRTGTRYNSVRIRNVKADAVVLELARPSVGMANIKREALADDFARLCDYTNEKGVLPVSVWTGEAPGTVIFAASPDHS